MPSSLAHRPHRHSIGRISEGRRGSLGIGVSYPPRNRVKENVLPWIKQRIVWVVVERIEYALVTLASTSHHEVQAIDDTVHLSSTLVSSAIEEPPRTGMPIIRRSI